MTAPVQRRSARTSALPEPELITLLDDPNGPYANSPVGWWTEYGGALDVRSGVVHLPPTATPPPCPFPCSLCKRRGAQ